MSRVTLFSLVVQIFASGFAVGQQVPKRVVAEHFTNTYCSICAARNPGLFATMWQYPQVLHIAYHPSSPYAACPLNRYNIPENDERTKFYGVYGGTPQLVVQGDRITSAFTDTTIYTARLNQTTSFDMTASLMTKGTDSVSVSIVVKKVAASSLTALQLFGAIVEDTLFFSASNGEQQHFDVFRKALWGITPLAVTAPAAVGDSTVYTKTIMADAAWPMYRMYALAILQESGKQVVQAARSGRLPVTGVNDIVKAKPVSIFPNPVSERLYVDASGLRLPASVVITDHQGRVVRTFVIDKHSASVDVSSLSAGMYYLKANDDAQLVYGKFLKK